MSTPQNEFDGAQRILKKYYRELMKQMAEEIIQQRNDFESPGQGAQANVIIDKYALQLQRLSAVFSNLNQFALRDLPEGKYPIGKDEFRCFKCGAVIRRGDDACQLCGWNWKL